MNYDIYNIPKDVFKSLFADYLQTDGTHLMNITQLHYDILNEYKNYAVDFWDLFNIDSLFRRYIDWRNASGNKDKVDSEWPFTVFVERLCSSYQIQREHYSYYVPKEGEEWLYPEAHSTKDGEIGRIYLRNSHMLRMLRVKRGSVAYDGTRESLNQLLDRVFRVETDSETDILTYALETSTAKDMHASLRVLLSSPGTSSPFWNLEDSILFAEGSYFLEILGIETLFQEVGADTLIYDYNKWVDDEEIEQKVKFE